MINFQTGRRIFFFYNLYAIFGRSIEFSYDAEDQYRPIKTRQISLNRRSNLFHFPFRVSSCCASAYASLSKIPWNDFSSSFLPSTPSPSLANAHTHTHTRRHSSPDSFVFLPSSHHDLFSPSLFRQTISNISDPRTHLSQRSYPNHICSNLILPLLLGKPY